MHEIDLIYLSIRRKFSRVITRLGYLLVVLFFDHAGDGFGEAAELVGNRVGSFRQVNDRERGLLAGAFAAAGLQEGIRDPLSHFRRGHRGVSTQRRQPVCVIPAHTGLGLFRRDHVVRKVIEHEGILRSGHKTCVKADDIKLNTALLQRIFDPGELHGTIAEVLLVIAVSAHRTAAVIPKDQFIAVCGIILGAPLDIFRKVVGVCHGRRAGVLDQALYAAVHDLIDLVDLAADDIVAPVPASAGIYKKVDLFAEIGGSHLLKVRRAHPAAGLQVRSAQVHHDRDGVFAAALDLPPPPWIFVYFSRYPFAPSVFSSVLEASSPFHPVEREPFPP